MFEKQNFLDCVATALKYKKGGLRPLPSLLQSGACRYVL